MLPLFYIYVAFLLAYTKYTYREKFYEKNDVFCMHAMLNLYCGDCHVYIRRRRRLRGTANLRWFIILSYSLGSLISTHIYIF